MNKLIEFLFGVRVAENRQPDNLWNDEIPIPPDHSLVPATIRGAAAPWLAKGCMLHRAQQTDDGVEWWLIDLDGELVEVLLEK